MGTVPSKNSHKTVVIGANGSVGIATLESIALRNDEGNLDVYAGVRDEEKFKRHMLDIPTIPMDMANRRQMTQNLKGFERAFIIVPCERERTGLASIALQACKAAGVQFVLLLSVTIANTETIFGKQFKPIEERAKTLGIPYTIIRLPMFMDNTFAHARSVRTEDRIVDPRDPRQQFASVSLQDVGMCAAEILHNPERHCGKVYNLVSQKYSMIDLSQSMSKILKRDIKVREINWERFRESLEDNQIPEWQIEGLIEWLDSSYDRRLHEGDLGTIEAITGRRPCSLDHFVATNAKSFGWVC